MLKNLPEKTVERLSQYRRVLLNYQFLEHGYIYSHNLARILKTNPANVRRDLMLIGVSGDVHKGYEIVKLIESIGDAIDGEQAEKVCFVGIGELGRTVSEYFSQPSNKLKIAATFHFDNHQPVAYSDVPSYNISTISEIIKKEDILISVLAVPKDYAREICMILVNSGVIGILNFSSVYLQVPKHVYVENYDMITKLEKIAYFMKRHSVNNRKS
ncbi:MAG: redox-sensing transcriptional repressor Rex [Bacteroidales bacterium]|nr:redox-sensing transcriptional repressor Rex [Bacteroidales bacterium]MDP2235191.1 redox-sensing transcriptional repressor Rex [Bacteroidales bacterium]